MRIIKFFALFLVITVGALAAVGFLLPSTTLVERTITINAPVETVFAQVNDLMNHQRWSPWREMDPHMIITYGNITKGKGASYSWSGDKAGLGSLTIIESTPNEYIVNDLDFHQKGKAKGCWVFKATEEGTYVNWVFWQDAGNNIVGRYFGLMLDHFIGKQFEKGLENLKRISEKATS